MCCRELGKIPERIFPMIDATVVAANRAVPEDGSQLAVERRLDESYTTLASGSAPASDGSKLGIADYPGREFGDDRA